MVFPVCAWRFDGVFGLCHRLHSNPQNPQEIELTHHGVLVDPELKLSLWRCEMI